MKGQGFLFAVKTYRRQPKITNNNILSLVPCPLSLIIFIYLFALLSCLPENKKVDAAIAKHSVVQPQVIEQTGARPSAILRTGQHPIWFQLTEKGPVHIESAEDAVLSCAFIPWPLALHVRFFYERNGEIVIAVNRGGFLKISPNSGSQEELAMFYFPGGEFWKQYTVGGFINYNDQDIALLYLDDRFLNTDTPPPNPRTWSFNMESNMPFAVSFPVLELFPADEGWDADTLRLGNDGFWYYRAAKRNDTQPEIHFLRTENPAQAGINISADDFFNSLPEDTGFDFSVLPSLPHGFVYTGISGVGGSLFACWEEQNDYCIGAAGFMLIKK